MKQLSLLFAFFILLGCPSGPAPDPQPDPDPDPPSNLQQWDPTTYFEQIEMPPESLLQPDPLPELSGNPFFVEVTVEDLRRNPDLLSSSKADHFLLLGDFSSLGRIRLNREPSQKRIVIAGAYDVFGSVPKDMQTVIDAFDVMSGSYVFTKIWFESNNNEKFGVTYTTPTRISESNGNTFHRCRWTNAVSCIRGVNTSWNTLQFCAANERALVPTDGALVGWEATKGKESRGNRVLFCETVDLPDGIGGTPWANNDRQNGTTPGTVFAFNTSVKTNAIHRPIQRKEKPFCAYMGEDGFDCKNGGSSKPEDRSYFFGNIHSGSRPTGIDCKDGKSSCASAGSAGWGLGVWHNHAKNWDVIGNLSIDDISGVQVKPFVEDDPRHKVENIRVKNNVIAYMANCNPGGYSVGSSGRPSRENENNGLALRVMCETCEVSENVVIGAENPLFGPTKAKIGKNYFLDGIEGLTYIKTEVIISPLLDPSLVLVVDLPYIQDL